MARGSVRHLDAPARRFPVVLIVTALVAAVSYAHVYVPYFSDEAIEARQKTIAGQRKDPVLPAPTGGTWKRMAEVRDSKDNTRGSQELQ
jgi:hypothetical protein